MNASARRGLRLASAAIVGMALSALGGAVVLAAPLPPLPGAAPAAAPAPSPPPAPAATALPTLERVTRGVVTLERDGRLVGLGTVLSGDGRVITALSALGGQDAVDVRYADGTTAHAKVGHRDKTWDLALLIPLSGKWTEGLVASELDPSATELRGLVATRPGHPTIVPAQLKGSIEARPRDGGDTLNALDVELKGGNASGAPITDAQGGVVAVLVRACKPADSGPCSPLTIAAPVGALRQFLVRTPLNAVAPSPWLGIVGEPDTSGNSHGVRVMAIAPQSPADKGGLKTSTDRSKADLIMAVDGQPVDTPERLADLIAKHAIGQTVKILVLSGDKIHELSVTLRAAAP